MNRLTVFILGLGLSAAGACSAQDAQFCQSMCTSQQQECRASAQLTPKEELLMPSDASSRNPLARTAEGAVPGQGARALSAAGATNRRIDRIDACNATHQRCTRSCAVQPDTIKPVAPPR
jgi:hypothetical protein